MVKLALLVATFCVATPTEGHGHMRRKYDSMKLSEEENLASKLTNVIASCQTEFEEFCEPFSDALGGIQAASLHHRRLMGMSDSEDSSSSSSPSSSSSSSSSDSSDSELYTSADFDPEAEAAAIKFHQLHSLGRLKWEGNDAEMAASSSPEGSSSSSSDDESSDSSNPNTFDVSRADIATGHLELGMSPNVVGWKRKARELIQYVFGSGDSRRLQGSSDSDSDGGSSSDSSSRMLWWGSSSSSSSSSDSSSSDSSSSSDDAPLHPGARCIRQHFPSFTPPCQVALLELQTAQDELDQASMAKWHRLARLPLLVCALTLWVGVALFLKGVVTCVYRRVTGRAAAVSGGGGKGGGGGGGICSCGAAGNHHDGAAVNDARRYYSGGASERVI